MSNEPTGIYGVGVPFTDDNCKSYDYEDELSDSPYDAQSGRAYQRSGMASEYGLPVGYDDPNQYRGKTPACERIIGIGRL